MKMLGDRVGERNRRKMRMKKIIAIDGGDERCR